MNSTVLKLAFVAVFATVLGLATLAEAAVLGPDFDNVGFTQLKKERYALEGVLRVRNASEATEIDAFETLFDTDNIVIWDKIERGEDSDLDRIDLDLDHDKKSGIWSLDADNDDDETEFDPGNIVGFAVKAGYYTAYFKFDEIGLDLDSIVAFNSLAYYANELFGDQHHYKDKYFDKELSHLTVFGVNEIVAVPLPRSASMLGLALFAFGALSWRRKRLKAA